MSNNSAGVPAISQSGSVVNFASGIYTGDGSGAINVAVGFTPRYVKVIDVTDVTQWEWMECLPATNTLKTTSVPGISIDTNSLIVANVDLITVTEVAYPSPGSQTPTDGTQGTVSIEFDSPYLTTPNLTFASGLNTSSKVYTWIAFG